jgi:hypothetical protein
MRDQKKAEAIATQRVQLLSPLLTEGLDPAKARQIKNQICEQAGISERTLRRYLSQYKENGFDGLKPKGKNRNRTKKPFRHTSWNKQYYCDERFPSAVWPNHPDFRMGRPGPARTNQAQHTAGETAERGYSTRQMKMYMSTGVATGDTSRSIATNFGIPTSNTDPTCLLV